MPDLALVKQELKIAELAAEEGVAATYWDAELQDLLDRTIDAVQRELDWYFGSPRSADEILDGTGLPSLWVRQYFVNASVTVSNRSAVGDAWEVVDTDDYEFEVGKRGLFHASEWTRGHRNYRVQYTEGFATWPGDVQQLVLDLISSRWETRGTDKNLKSERIGDYAYTRGELQEMPGWAEVWAHWKRGRI